MKRTYKLLMLVLFSIICLLIFTGCYGVKKSKIVILEDAENITQTVAFRSYSGPYVAVIFKAKYRGADKMFFNSWFDDEDLWTRAINRIEVEDVKNIVFLNKKIKDDAYNKKYTDGMYSKNLVCFSKNESYYGINITSVGWGTQFSNEFEIDETDLTDLYIDMQENMDIVNPDYEVLNYGTFKIEWHPSEDYDYFYFVNSREVYIYDGETKELIKTIETDTDIYGAAYKNNIEKFCVAVKDGNQFRIIKYDIIEK